METDQMVVARLRAAGCVFAEEEAAILTASAGTSAELDLMVERRAGGEPIEQVVGWAEFAGLRVLIDPGVFVPRRRSEFLVEVAVQLAGPPDGTAGRVITDLCCGTGALGLAVAAALTREVEAAGAVEAAGTVEAAPGAQEAPAAEATRRGEAAPAAEATRAAEVVPTAEGLPTAEVDPLVKVAGGEGGGLGSAGVRLRGFELYAADLDPAAVACARRNVEPAGGHVYAGDLFSALPDSLRGRISVLICNAPYVPTTEIAFMPSEARDHEALMALDGGADGLAILRRVAADAVAWLAPGGVLLVETSERQAASMTAVMTAAGLAADVHTDDEWGATVVTGIRAAA